MILKVPGRTKAQVGAVTCFVNSPLALMRVAFSEPSDWDPKDECFVKLLQIREEKNDDPHQETYMIELRVDTELPVAGDPIPGEAVYPLWEALGVFPPEYEKDLLQKHVDRTLKLLESSRDDIAREQMSKWVAGCKPPLSLEKAQRAKPTYVTDPCPECGHQLVRTGGEKLCQHCAWSSSGC